VLDPYVTLASRHATLTETIMEANMRQVVGRTLSAWLRATPLLMTLSWMGAFTGPQAGMNEWTTTGPAGGSIRALAIDPRTPATLYAATQKGVFKSIDGGGHWSTTNPGRSIVVLAIDPQAPATIYAGTTRGANSPADVLKSTDGGATWSASGLPTVYSDALALAVDPRTPSIVYAGTLQGVFKSTDGGATWVARSTGLSGMAIQVFTLAIDPVAPDNVIAGTLQGVFKSTNGGTTWSATGLNTPLFIHQIVFDPATPTTLYAGTALDVYRSADGGWTWTKLDTDLRDVGVRALAIDPPTTLYAGTEGGVVKSVDGGATWKTVRARASIRALAIDPLNPANVYAGAEEQGVYKSADAGESWSPASTGMQMRTTYDLAIDPRDPTVLYASTFGGLLRSGGGESDWTQTDLTAPIGRLAIDPGNPDTLYAAAVYDGPYKTTDGGATWITPIGGPRAGSLAVSPETPAAIYAGHEFRDEFENLYFTVSKSTDGGRSWSRSGLRLSYSYVAALAIDPRTPSTVYAGSSGDSRLPGRGVYKSTDGGAGWVEINVGLDHREVRALAIDPQSPATLYAATFGGGVFKSTDGGGAWSSINAGLADLSIVDLAIDSRTPTSLYAGTASGGVFKSPDGGGTWAPLGTGHPPGPIIALAVGSTDPTTVYAATNNGVFVLSELGSAPNRPPIADAGADQIAEATSPEGASVTLAGSGSSDPDGDPLGFAWSWSSGSAGGDRPVVTLPLGTTTVTLTVSDPQGASATDDVEITVRDTTPPEVALSAPEDGATVSGTINVSAGAMDAVEVAGVQLLIDGEPLGPEDTSEPREVPWDTRTASDGTHELSARGRDGAGNLATAATVTVTVANGPVPAVGLARYEESAATLAPPGAWSEIASDDVGVAMSGSRAVYAGAAGGTATFTFTGTGVRWIGFPCERCGVAEVLIDGTRAATVDTYSPERPAFSTAMYTSPRLELGTHTLVITVSGTANTSSAAPFIVIDAIDSLLDGAGVLAPVQPTPFGALGAVEEVAPGGGSSAPHSFTPAGPLVFFTADDNIRGRELWAIPKSALH
jgi:photosystem II stability/assembly factor-like uncharacterized protein